jgi:Ca2+-binding RTX toxin-like protein
MSFIARVGGRGRRRVTRSAVLVSTGALFAFQALAIIGATSAFADTCAFNLATNTATVTQALGDFSELSVDTAGAIELDDVDCAGANVTNTTTISVLGSTGDETLQIDGDEDTPAGPGFPATISFAWDGAASGFDELQIEGRDTADTITLSGSGSANIDSDAAVDVTTSGVEFFEIDGDDGNDVISAATFTSTVPFAVTVFGDNGDDTITGSAGPDCLHGNDDNDTVDGGAGGDTTNEEGVDGGPGDDTLSGGAGVDFLNGGDGVDIYNEGTAANGADTIGQGTLDCGNGNVGDGVDDTVNYGGRTAAVTADNDDVADDGEAGEGDNINSAVDNIAGGSGNDTLSGNGNDNVLTGNGGNDALDGNGGTDTASYSTATAAVTVDLTAGTATGGAGSDTLAEIEDVNGSNFNDTLTGNSSSNTLDGLGGDDLINGAGGSDTEEGGSGNDTFNQGDTTNGGDDILGEAGLDWVNYGARTLGVTVTLNTACCDDGESGEGDDVDTVENATLGTSDDTFTGDAFNNIVQPNGGQNALIGGAGGDSLDYSVGYTAGVTIDLGGGASSVDSISEFENVTGTDFADSITGSATNNLIKSGKGADRVRAGAGDDTVRAGAGNDNVRGSSGDDDLFGMAGNDSLSGGSGDDFCSGGKGKDTRRGCESGHA